MIFHEQKFNPTSGAYKNIKFPAPLGPTHIFMNPPHTSIKWLLPKWYVPE